MHSFVNKADKYAKLIWSSQFYNKINKTHRFSETQTPSSNATPTCSETLKRFNEALQRFIEALSNFTCSCSLSTAPSCFCPAPTTASARTDHSVVCSETLPVLFVSNTDKQGRGSRRGASWLPENMKEGQNMFWPPEMSQKQVSHHEGWKTCQKWKTKLIFLKISLHENVGKVGVDLHLNRRNILVGVKSVTN